MKVLVVLGKRLNDDGSMTDFLLGRLNAALKAYKEDGFDRIVVTGGIANQAAGRAEATAMHEWLLSKGVPDDVITVEDTSKTTKENAKFCRTFFEQWGVKEITLISSAYHIERKWLNPIKLFKRYAKVEIAAAIKS